MWVFSLFLKGIGVVRRNLILVLVDKSIDLIFFKLFLYLNGVLNFFGNLLLKFKL